MIEYKFDLDDILLTPATLSKINSRKEVYPFDENGMLPIMTAPMDTVISESNVLHFTENKIYGVIPRNANLTAYSEEKTIFYSYGINEFKEMFLDIDKPAGTHYALIDIANGHMNLLFEYARDAKVKYGEKLVLMVGNIANPKAYYHYAKIDVDYIRLGIGGGSACFIEETPITTSTGKKEICQIEIGEQVLTHLNTYEEVIGKVSFISEEMCIALNDETTSTLNHEYYVIHKQFKDIVIDENIHQFAKWVAAEELNEDYFLLELE